MNLVLTSELGAHECHHCFAFIHLNTNHRAWGLVNYCLSRTHTQSFTIASGLPKLWDLLGSSLPTRPESYCVILLLAHYNNKSLSPNDWIKHPYLPSIVFSLLTLSGVWSLGFGVYLPACLVAALNLTPWQFFNGHWLTRPDNSALKFLSKWI